MGDRILIRDLRVRCIVGIRPKERVVKQTVAIQVMLAVDLRRAGQTDDIADTVDYKVLKDRIVAAVGASRHFLIEKLAQQVADLCLADRRVKAATVTVDKPGALTGARSVAVEITRGRGAR